MINVYDKFETDFTHNGLRVLSDTTSCKITEELNKGYSLELEYPIDEQKKYLNLVGLNIIKAKGQLFRIPIQTNNQDNGSSVRVSANHIFYDLANDYNEDTRAENKSVEEALKIAIAVNPKFSVGVCDNLGLGTGYFVSESPTSSIYKKIIPRWGGELYRDNYKVAIKQRLGKDTGILISYGKDIHGFTQTLDWSGLATRIKPIGKDGCVISLVNGGSNYLVSPRVAEYPFVITKEVKFDNIEDATELKNAGLALWGTIDLPSCNYSVKPADLSKTEEYKSLKDLLVLNLGDSVIIRHKIFNCDLTARVIKIVFNVLTDSIESLELGQFKDNIANKFNKMDGKIQYNETSITETKADLKSTKVKITEDIEGLSLEVSGKVGETEVKSIIQQSPENIKIGFNAISDIVDIDETGLKVSHGGTDYTHMGADGFKRHTGSTDKDYHYLMETGTEFATTNATDGTGEIIITVPAEFIGKNFKCHASLAHFRVIAADVVPFQVKVWDVQENYSNGTVRILVAAASVDLNTKANTYSPCEIGITYILLA